MKRKIFVLLRYINRFSFFPGILTYSRLGFLEKETIILKSYPKIFIRKNTTDLDTFNQVLLNLEYDVTINRDCKIIIDAGANIGLTSLFFSNKYPKAKIISIEPEMDNFRYLIRNCSTRKNILPINKALWHNNDPIYLTKSVAKDSHSVSHQNITDEMVQTITIPEIMNFYGLSEIDILKLDIEGAEKEIFSNNIHAWLPKVKYLIIELHDRFLPGCSMKVFQALTDYCFSTQIKGELMIFTLNGRK